MFDLRDVNGVSYVTPIKCQAPFGTCWGFAAIAAAETSILGSGLAQEDGYAAAIKKQLLNKRAVEIGYCADSKYYDDFSQEIITLSTDTWAVYNPAPVTSNHAVTIIGWDDNYPKENFVLEPPENGAWLVKNSWGSEEVEFPNVDEGNWGLLQGQDKAPYQATSDVNTGYFWLSYYDATIENPEALSFDKSNVGKEYVLDEHDYMPVQEMNGAVVKSEVKMANVFQAEYGQKLEQISFQTSAPGTTATYEVYLLAERFTDPQDGILVATGTDTYEFGGYHKEDVELIEPWQQIEIPRGGYYSIVVKQETPDGEYAVSMPMGMSEQQAGEYANTWQKGIINKKESFLYVDGEWADYSDKALRARLLGEESMAEFDNFPIKGYSTKNGSDLMMEGELVPGSRSALCTYIGGESPNTIPIRLMLRGSTDIPEDAAVVWSQSPGSEEFFDVVPVEGAPNRADIYAGGKSAGMGYFCATVPGIGTTVNEVSTYDLTMYYMDLPDDTFTYTGEPIVPEAVPVTQEDVKLEEGVEFSLEYANNVKCGVATVTATPLIKTVAGNPTEKYFIVPAQASVESITVGENSLTATLKDQGESGLSGYEVGYRTGAEADWESATFSTNSVTIKGLTAGKAYQVRARGFVKVDGEKHYGEWGEAITSGEVKAGSAEAVKAANPLLAKGKTIKVKQAKLKKKARSFKRSRAIKVSKAQGAVTYKKLSGNKKIVVNAKTGKVKVKKGLKKKTYRVKVRVTAAGNAAYATGSKTVVVKVRVI